jgi:hypothetical protein
MYIVIVIVVAVAIGLYWYFGRESKDIRVETTVETTEEAVEVLSAAPQVDVETNPVKKVPDLNPVEKVNPFKTSNPFE